MAWAFDEVNDYVTLGDDAALTLPNGDWTIGGWTKLTDNTGTLYQYFMSWGAFMATPAFQWFFTEASEGAAPNKLSWRFNSTTTNSTGTYGSSTAWQHIALQRSGTTVSLYVNGSADATTSSLSAAVNVADTFYIGTRQDLNVDRFFGGTMSEWAKWDRALSADELASLALGYSPIFMKPVWYLPMQTAYTETRVPLTVTNNGSTYGDHPRIHVPEQPKLIIPSGGGSTGKPWAYREVLRRSMGACA